MVGGRGGIEGFRGGGRIGVVVNIHQVAAHAMLSIQKTWLSQGVKICTKMKKVGKNSMFNLSKNVCTHKI